MKRNNNRKVTNKNQSTKGTRNFKIYFVCFFLTCSSAHALSQNVEGMYSQIDNNGVKVGINLTFQKRDFSIAVSQNVKNDLQVYICCDTIAYGRWRFSRDKKKIYLNSFNSVDTSRLNINVAEKVLPRADSIWLKIDNPIENHLSNDDTRKSNLDYLIYTYMDGKPLLIKKTDLNMVNLPKEIFLQRFFIKIRPKQGYIFRSIGLKEVCTKDYLLKDAASNDFFVQIPQLTYEFIAYLRLHNSSVKIINRQYLRWDGFTFKKQ